MNKLIELVSRGIKERIDTSSYENAKINIAGK